VILFQVLQESELSVPCVNANAASVGMFLATEMKSPVNSPTGAYDCEVIISRCPENVVTSAFNYDSNASIGAPGYESSNSVHVSQNDPFNPAPSSKNAAMPQISTPALESVVTNTTLFVHAGATSNSSMHLTEQGIDMHRELTQTARASARVVSTSRAGAGTHALMDAGQYRAPPWSPLNQLRNLPHAARYRNNVAH
jgi:hypothetical protein